METKITSADCFIDIQFCVIKSIKYHPNPLNPIKTNSHEYIWNMTHSVVRLRAITVNIRSLCKSISQT